MELFNQIKSKFLQKAILKNIKTRRLLKIFKYSKFYQLKLNINKYDFLIYFFANLPIHVEEYICSENINYRFEELMEYIPKNITKEIFIKDIVQYCIYQNDLFLSLNNEYFYEIIKEKASLNKKNISIIINIKEF